MENFRDFRGLASNRKGFPANFCLSYYKVLYNRESFPANNRKIMQPRNVSTANDLHYTVYDVQSNEVISNTEFVTYIIKCHINKKLWTMHWRI